MYQDADGCSHGKAVVGDQTYRWATGARKSIHSAELDGMTRDHVSPRYGAAILVAVVGLIVGVGDVAAAREPLKSKARAVGSGPSGER